MARVPSTTGSWWQYAQWVKAIARNMRITAPTTGEMTAVKIFIKQMYDASTGIGSRTWLKQDFDAKSAKPSGYNPGDVDHEPDNVVIKLLAVIARDMEVIPIITSEKVKTDALISSTGNRRYGTTPYYGSVAGSLVTVP